MNDTYSVVPCIMLVLRALGGSMPRLSHASPDLRAGFILIDILLLMIL